MDRRVRSCFCPFVHLAAVHRALRGQGAFCLVRSGCETSVHIDGRAGALWDSERTLQGVGGVGCIKGLQDSMVL